MQELIDQQIGYYLVEDLIGQGGIAKVYRAYDERFKRHVAIKIINRDELDLELVKERFIQEAQIIAALEHHAIVPVYDFGEYRNRSYIVMRLMRGGSLRERLLNGPLALGTAADILDRVGSSLDRAHDSGIIHRDLKPANILFDADDIAFLADFGMARFTQMTITGMIIGSPHYMSPEQSRGANLDRRSDVYQLGVVLYEILTGQIPFDGESIDSVLYQHVHENPPPMRHLVPDLPIEAEEIVGRALAKDPDDRYSTTGELAKMVRKLADKYGYKSVLPSPVTLPHQNKAQMDLAAEVAFADTLADSKPRRSEVKTSPAEPVPQLPAPSPWSIIPLWIWPTVAIATVILGIGLFWLAGLGGNDSAEEEALADVFLTEEPTEEVPTPTLGVPDDSAMGAGESAAAPEVDEAETEIPIGLPVPIPNSTFLLSSEAFAELTGGTALAYGSSPIEENALEFNVFVWEADANLQLTTIEVDDLAPDWSADGQTIVYHSQRRDWEIYMMDAGGANLRNLTENEFNDIFPQWTPDGRILFQSDRDDINGRTYDLYIMDADGGNVERLTDSPFDDTNPVISADGRIAYTSKQQIGGYTVDQIYVLDLNTGENTQITYDEQFGSFTPAWSPDGSKLAFWSDRGDGPKIYVIDEDGSLPTVVTDIVDPAYFPEWSPNGEWIVFHRAMRSEDPSGPFELINRDLWMVKADGSVLQRLTNTPDAQERQPDFRP